MAPLPNANNNTCHEVLAIVEWEAGAEIQRVKVRLRLKSSTFRSSVNRTTTTVIDDILQQVEARLRMEQEHHHQERNSYPTATATTRHWKIQIFDATVSEYRPLDEFRQQNNDNDNIIRQDNDDSHDNVPELQTLLRRFGKSRWRLQAVARDTVSPTSSSSTTTTSPILAIQGRQFSANEFAIPHTTHTLQFAEAHNQPNTTAFTVWDASLYLARYLAEMTAANSTENNPGNLFHHAATSSSPPQHVVLELGAGCGLAGLTAAALGLAQTVILTDLSHALPTRQVDLNRTVWEPHCHVSCHALDWFHVMRTQQPNGNDSNSSSNSQHDPLDFVPAQTALVVVADCVWTLDLLPPLLSTMQALLQRLPGNVTFLISYQQRGSQTHQAFLQGLQDLFGGGSDNYMSSGSEKEEEMRTLRQIPEESWTTTINPRLFLFEGKRIMKRRE